LEQNYIVKTNHYLVWKKSCKD